MDASNQQRVKNTVVVIVNALHSHISANGFRLPKEMAVDAFRRHKAIYEVTQPPFISANGC